MKSIGIQKSSGIEIVDATVVDGSIVPSQCPGNLGISCSVCPHAWMAGAVSAPKKNKKGLSFPLLICRWHEEQPGGKATSPGGP